MTQQHKHAAPGLRETTRTALLVAVLLAVLMAVLMAVFAAYLRPNLWVTLANGVWSCF